MDIETAVPAIGAADETLTGLIGDRFYYGFLPDDATLPAAIFFRVSATRDHNIDSRSARFQITAWAENYPAAGAVEAAIEDTFIRYKDRMAVDLVITQGVIEVPGYDLPPETDEQGTRYGRACDVVLHYRTDI